MSVLHEMFGQIYIGGDGRYLGVLKSEIESIYIDGQHALLLNVF